MQITTDTTSAATGDETPATFDAGLLADLTRALLPFLGPYSITTVKRAARSSENLNELLRHVAAHIDDMAKREMFMKSGKRIVNDYQEEMSIAGAAQIAAASITSTQQARTLSATASAVDTDDKTRPATPVTAELAQRGEAALAPIIGPLASVLVSRYAAASKNSRDFLSV
ncbi:MAG: hypothetical protein HC782_03465 [Gammaproteobacteria bacterium]|nr:hypothetical protein [Gammaproteobacteria bacterium]